MKRLVFLSGRSSRLLLLVLLLLLTGSWQVSADSVQSGPTFTVNTTDDVNDQVCGIDHCSLREAIIAANAQPDANTIILPSGIYPLTITGSNEDNAQTGDLDILADLTITGSGPHETIIDAGGPDGLGDRVFDGLAGQLSLVDLTITGGVPTISDDDEHDEDHHDGDDEDEDDDHQGDQDDQHDYGDDGGPKGDDPGDDQPEDGDHNGDKLHGAGIKFTGASLTLTRVVLADNTQADAGGGLWFNSSGSLTLIDSTLHHNQADNGGGLQNSGIAGCIHAVRAGARSQQGTHASIIATLNGLVQIRIRRSGHQ